MVTNDRNITVPRFRVYGEIAEFETERHLEWFFWHTALARIGLKPLTSQHACREGICDILAQGTENQLVVIELKNTQDSHVIHQITKYFDALKDEQPFAGQIDYTKPIELYTVCPSYRDRTELILKYHKLKFTLLSYTVTVKSGDQGFVFTLSQWSTKTEVAQIEVPLATAISPELNLPDPPKSFVDLLGKSSEAEKQWVIQVRDQIYRFSQNLNYKISEQPDGKWIRFERNKQNPIAELGWDNKRNSLAMYLWLPFSTINGRWNREEVRDNYKRTAMMRLWVVDGIVKDVGYIENGRKSWLVVTNDELRDGTFSKPTKLQKWGNKDSRYWKGLAMPTQFYLKMMGISDRSESSNSFVELALEHSRQRLQRSRQKNSSGTVTDQ